MAQQAEKEKDEDFDIDGWIEAIGANGPGVPTPKIKISTGVDVEIKKVTAAQLYLLIDLVKQIAIHLNVKNFDDLSGAIAAVQDPITFLELVGGSVDRLTDLVAALCSLGEPTVKTGLDLDDLLLIALAEWTVNEHFFTTRLLPMIRRLDTGEQLQKQEA